MSSRRSLLHGVRCDDTGMHCVTYHRSETSNLTWKTDSIMFILRDLRLPQRCWKYTSSGERRCSAPIVLSQTHRVVQVTWHSMSAVCSVKWLCDALHYFCLQHEKKKLTILPWAIYVKDFLWNWWLIDFCIRMCGIRYRYKCYKKLLPSSSSFCSKLLETHRFCQKHLE
jgi:hypothetical protein